MILLIRSLLCVYYKYPIINLIILREGDTVNIHLRIGSSIRKEQLLMRKKEQMDYQIKGSQKVIETDSSNTNLGERSRAIRAKLGLLMRTSNILVCVSIVGSGITMRRGD